MALAISNNRVRSALERGVAAIDTGTNAGAINAGDIVYNTGAGAASLLGGSSLTAAIVAQIGKLLGVSIDTYPIPYSDGITETVTSPSISLYTQGEFSFATNPGDALVPGSPVTIGNGAQTVTLAPVGPTMAGSSASGTGGTWSAAAHTVEATLLTALGETTPGTSASVTVTSGENIVTETATVPAWALGVCYYVDGLFAGFSATGVATTLAGPSTDPRAVPVQNALAIGTVAQDQSTVGGTIGSTITGATGQNVVVKLAL